MYIYKIRNKQTGEYFKTLENSSYVTSVEGNRFPSADALKAYLQDQVYTDEWEVVEFELTENEKRTIPIDKVNRL